MELMHAGTKGSVTEGIVEAGRNPKQRNVRKTHFGLPRDFSQTEATGGKDRAHCINKVRPLRPGRRRHGQPSARRNRELRRGKLPLAVFPDEHLCLEYKTQMREG